MKKTIYIFIFILPILLLSCSGSSKEPELKKQLETAEQKNQELIKDATLALINLGYTQFAAYKAVKQSLKELNEEYDLSKLITVSLKHI